MKQLDSTPRRLNVAGYCLCVYEDDGSPVLFLLEGTTHFLPIFSTIQKCWDAMYLAGLTEKIKPKAIVDGPEFFESLGGIRVMLDPWINENGDTRFTEVQLESSANACN